MDWDHIQAMVGGGEEIESQGLKPAFCVGAIVQGEAWTYLKG